MKNKFTSLFFVLVAAALVLSACGAQPAPPVTDTPPAAPDAVVAEGHIVPNEKVYLSFVARGRVADILVAEGDSVKAGDVLVRLGDTEQLEAALAGAQLELTAAQQAMDDLMRSADGARAAAWQEYMKAESNRFAAERVWEKIDVDDTQKKIDDARATMEDKKSELKDAQEEFDKYASLQSDNPTRKAAEDALKTAQDAYNEALRVYNETSNQRDNAQAVLDAARYAEKEAKRKFDLTKDGPDADKLALLEARLENAKAQVAAAQFALANFELKAPYAGVVADINVTVGEYVGPEKYAVLLADFSQWYVETSDLTELEVVKVEVGQSVEVVPDAFDDTTLMGTVESISPVFKTQSGDILYTVKIKLNESDDRLRWGMTTQNTFVP
jgi:multidrug resistance efflux pump